VPDTNSGFLRSERTESLWESRLFNYDLRKS
jgi:hypothetical protein